MANPVILVNATGGSDTAASGAGPATALTGTAASYSGTVFTLDGAPDLSGVATDGSALIYVVTSIGRRWFTITAVDNAADTVTVTETPTGTASGLTWAIGGVRASIASTSSKRLFDISGAAGDAKPGWTIRMEDGHAETIAATLDQRSEGDNTTGGIVIEGEAGATTKPVLTFSNNGNAFVLRAYGTTLRNFAMVNTHGTKTASIAVTTGSGTAVPRMIDGLTIADATNYFWKGIVPSTVPMVIQRTEIGHCASHGIDASASSAVVTLVQACHIHDCGGDGIQRSQTGSGPQMAVEDCLIVDNAGDGIQDASTNTADGSAAMLIRRNTIDGNGGAGILISGDRTRQLCGLVIENNNLTNNGTYGLNLAATVAELSYYGATIRNNNYYNNTTATTTPDLTGFETGAIAVDPTYAGSGDYTPSNVALKVGFPTLPIGTGD